MKKFVLSGIVIASFIMFSLYYRLRGQPVMSTIPSNTPNPTTPAAREEEQIVQLSPIQNSPVPTSAPTPHTQTPTSPPSSGYKNGSFVGDAADAFYGNIQVRVIMQDGKITDVQFLQYPNDRSHSIEINQYAMPILKSEAIQAQSASVDIVSGATDSSQAFIQSLQSALSKAKT